MKKKMVALLLAICLLVSMMPAVFAETEDTEEEYQFDAVYIELTSNNSGTGSDTLDWLNESKENNASGTLKLVQAGENADEVKALSLKKIKGRGNSSWTLAEKKGYNITLDKKSELIDDAGSAKKWCLLGLGNMDWGDHTFLSTIAAFNLFQQLNGSSAISYRMVDLYVNGNYVGLYMLTEKVEINKERVNITEADMTEDENSRRTVNSSTADRTEEEQKLLDLGIQEFKYSPNTTVASDGGYIIESGCWYWNEACGFITSHNCYYILKEPEYVSFEQIYKIASYVQEFEDALFSETGYNEAGKHYTEYVDLDSAARMFLTDCFVEQGDFFFSSQYMYIDGDASGLSGKFLSGPGWDYDGYWLNDSLYLRDLTDSGAFNLVPQLLAKGDFVTTLYTINKDEFTDLVAAMDGDADTEGTLRNYANFIAEAQAKNDEKWDFDYPTCSAAYISQFSNRVTSWNTLWSDTTNALRGVTISNEDGTLTATAYGAASYQWYRVDDSDMTKGVAIEGATESTYVLPENSYGYYYVQVSGEALKGTSATEMTSNPITITMDEPQLAAYRESAKSELSSYRSATDYRAAQQTELADAITAGTAAIDAAETPEAVTAALNAAKAAIDQIKTDAQLTEEEQGNLSAKPDPDQDTNTDTKPETDPDTDTESETSIPFTDVLADSWYEEPVGWAVANQITKGTSLTLFSPQKNCTRGEIVTFLWRMAGEPEPTIENPFADLTDESAYYYKAAIWAYENSITLGTSTTNLVFAPGDLCSRAQFVTLLWRIDQEPKVKTNFQFTDVEEGSYYYDAVLWAFTTEITKGTSMTQFSPSKTCTRAEAVTFLYRYAND